MTGTYVIDSHYLRRAWPYSHRHAWRSNRQQLQCIDVMKYVLEASLGDSTAIEKRAVLQRTLLLCGGATSTWLGLL